MAAIHRGGGPGNQLDRHRRRLRLRPVRGGRRPGARGSRRRAARMSSPSAVSVLERHGRRLNAQPNWNPREVEASLRRLGRWKRSTCTRSTGRSPRTRISKRAGRRWSSSRSRATSGTSAFRISTSPRCSASRQIAPVDVAAAAVLADRSRGGDEILPFAEREGIGVIVYSPMSSGLLTGAMTRERVRRCRTTTGAPRDQRFAEPQLSRSSPSPRGCRRSPIATNDPRGGRSRVDAPEPRGGRRDRGIRGRTRWIRCVAAASLELTDEDIAEIEGAGSTR